MFYYWLVPVLILAVIAVFLFAYSSKRKSSSPQLKSEGDDTPDPIKRGRYLNK
jgi:hypothetical protein